MWVGENSQARWLFTSRFSPDGTSKGSFDNFNLALHVGDEPQSVIENRKVASTLVGSDAHAVIWPHLTHSTTALEITSLHDEITPADILFTSNPEVTLATMSADCVPLIAIAQDCAFILAAHIGWKGAAGGIATIIDRIVRTHSVGNVNVILGPAICGRCYQVEGLRVQQVVQALPESQVGESGIDLRKGLESYFSNNGYDVNLIGSCTFETSELFSYRRNATAGRQAALVHFK